MSESQSKTAAEAQEAASSPEPASPRDRVSELEDEVSALKTQVKELIRTEAQLHRTQNDLDHQLKVFGKLHELGVEIGAVFDIDKIAESIVNFTLYELGYERAIVLLENPETGSFRLAAKDGYFGKKWKGVLDDFELPPDHPLVASVREGGEQTFPPQKGSDQAPDAGTLAAAEVLDLGEFLTYPLVLADRGLSGVIMAGNSESQKEHYVRTSNANSRAGLANLSAQAAAVLSSALSHEELAQERNLLDQKVKERTADLAKALEELEELDNAKSQFFANVSHELRTPLTLSIAPLEEILSESASVDEATKGRHLGVIYKNQLRLLKLINNLLDFAKVDAGRMGAKFRPHDVAGAIRFYAETMSSAAEARSIKLVLDLCADRMRLYVDPEKFEKVVMNLLSNAFKFTPDDGEIRITMTEDDTHLRIAVADTGIGIPEKALPKLFQRFMQVDASDKRQYEGTGIGLALVKEYATLHGGTVDVESVEGEGTTFTLTFVKGKDHLDPDSVIDADEEAVEAVSATNLADFDVDEGDEDAFDADDDLMAADLGVSQDEMVREAERLLDESGADADINDDDARVLVVDDVPDMRRFIAHVLKERYTVKTAKDGVQGLEAAAKWRPDLIVSDVMMPRKTGYELCEELKKSSDESLARTPVILLSAKAEMSQKLEGLEYGADDYLTKPFNANELLVRARNLIRLRRQEKKLHDERVRAVEAERRALETEMSVARDIQQTILPTVTAFDEDGIALTGYLDSASACSGDFWTWEKLASGDYLVILGDVAGHGAGSAMVTAAVFGAIKSVMHVNRDVRPVEVLAEVNRLLSTQPGMLWMTMVVGRIEAETGRQMWANAGHQPILYRGADGKLGMEHSSGPPLGRSPESVYEERELVAPGGGSLTTFVFSDGVVESENARGRQFGMRRLSKAFLGESDGVDALLADIRDAHAKFIGDVPPDDDVTGVLLKSGGT